MRCILTYIVSLCLFAGAASAQSLPGFEAPQFIGSASRPQALWTGDLNGDHLEDVVVAGETGELHVFLREANGTFHASAIYNLHESVTALAAGDFNADGHLDLAALSPSGAIRILAGTGTGTFGEPSMVHAGSALTGLAVADFNEDGRADLAVTDAAGLIHVFSGNGDGTFTASGAFSAGSSARGVVTGDFNADGHLDLALATAGGASIVLGKGDGSFGPAKIYATGAAQALAIADLNGDKLPDLVTLGASGGVSVLLGKRDGSFQSPVVYAAPEGVALVAGDLDGDGLADVLVSSPARSSATLLIGRGDGTFASPAEYFLGTPVSALARGTSAIVMADYNAGSIELFAPAHATAANPPTGSTKGGATDLVSGLMRGRNPVRTDAQTATTVTLTVSPNPGVLGHVVSLVALVAPASATGKVTFYDGAIFLGVAPVSGGSATLNTVLLPAGAGNLSARYDGDANYLASTSVKSLETVHAGAGNGFLPGSATYLSGYVPIFVAVGDFNGDGKQDLAAATVYGVSVLLGNGNGTFQNGVFYPTGTAPYSIAVADMNGDGILDLVVSNSGDLLTNVPGSVSVLLGTGTGTFQTAVNYNADTQPFEVVVADFNLDGVADVAVANSYSGDVSIFIGRGDGTLNPAANYTSGGGAGALAAGDYNGDGLPDLAVTNSTDGTVTILLSGGNGSFYTGSTIPVGGVPNDIYTADFNNDGILDLAVPDALNGVVIVMLGVGNGTFQAGVPYSTGNSGSSPDSVRVGDLNGDGQLDLVVTNYSDSNIAVLVGNGNGTFQPLVTYPGGVSPNTSAIGDFNGDGISDIAVAELGVANSGNSSGLGVLIGSGCSFTISPASLTYDVNGGTAAISVTASSSACAWTATSNSSWVTLSNSGGTGSGSVTVTVLPNTSGAERFGTAQIGNQTLNLTQWSTTQQFNDVPVTAYYFDAVNLLKNKNITAGCDPVDYCPAVDVTRAEMAIFIVRAVYGSDNFTYSPTPYFADVPASAFGFAWIQKLYELSITSGCGNGNFCPNDNVTRDQMAIFIIRARYGATTVFDYSPTPLFTDVPASYFAFSWIQRLKEDSVTAGCGTTLYCPTSPVTRGDMAIFVMRGAFNQLLPPTMPILTAVSPTTAVRGVATTLTITGLNTNFFGGQSVVSSISGLAFGTPTILSPTSLSVVVTPDPSVAPQPVSVQVITNAEEAVLPNALTIQ